MKKSVLILCIFSFLISCDNKTTDKKEAIVKPQNAENNQPNFGIVIHGGAGTILKKNMTPELEAEYKKVLEEAIRTGHEILKNGGSSLDAVEKTINVMEDSPLFNAGKGAVFTNDGKNELDASIMDGKTLNAGAVASVTTVKNPINLARAIMEKSEHVMLVKEGAEFFAKQNGIALVNPPTFTLKTE